jgi:hypothetical protein
MAPVLASLAWERFVKDPLPGPRRTSELTHTAEVADGVVRVSEGTGFPCGALTNQAVISREFGFSENFVLDPYQGVVGMVKALIALDERFHFDSAWGVDVGGDVLASRSYKTLRSPLADAMLLSALTQVFPDANVIVAGMGVDGEIPLRAWRHSVRKHLRTGVISAVSTFDKEVVDRMRRLLDARQVDTEATAMVVRAYEGLYGRYLVRDSGSVVMVDSSTIINWVYSAQAIAVGINPLVSALEATCSLDEASELLERRGFQSELRYEKDKVSRLGGAYRDCNSRDLEPRVRNILGSIKTIKPRIRFVAERHLSDRLETSLPSVRAALGPMEAAGDIALWPPFIELSRVFSPENVVRG